MRAYLVCDHPHSVHIVLLCGKRGGRATGFGERDFRRRVPVFVSVSHRLYLQTSGSAVIDQYVALPTALDFVDENEIPRTGLKKPQLMSFSCAKRSPLAAPDSC